MNLVPWNPFRDLDVGREMNNLFNLSPFQFFSGMTTPRVDLFQTEKDVVVKAEIPGVSKEDLNVHIDDNVIRLSGQTKRDDEYKDENIYRAERYYGSFSRAIPLPVAVKPEQAKAEYRDGVLTIRVPKAEPAKSSGRRIEIN